jgi:hypothetical protein
MKTGDVCLTVIGPGRLRPSNLSQSDADMLVRDWRAGSSGLVCRQCAKEKLSVLFVASLAPWHD